jgi:hypothetical protein
VCSASVTTGSSVRDRRVQQSPFLVFRQRLADRLVDGHHLHVGLNPGPQTMPAQDRPDSSDLQIDGLRGCTRFQAGLFW